MRTKTGIVVSAKGDKTVVIRVDTYVAHPLYSKRVRKTKRFHAHDEENRFNEGEKVVIQECRPYSKLKRWQVVVPGVA